MLRVVLLAATTLAMAPTVALAQDDSPTADLAVELAYEYCPAYFAGEIELEGPELAAIGLIGPAKTASHPRLGELDMLEVVRPDGAIAFAVGKDTRLCQIQVRGPNNTIALSKLIESLPRLGLHFERDAENSSRNDAGVFIETFRAPMEDGLTAYVQFMGAVGVKPQMTVFQFVMLEEFDDTPL